ncbi:DUF6994 family protein [Ruminococcus bicirculans (ex Wegman et al. 2014)]|uniref:Uncharacterized protein n=1 Tax=Ruminococcus bicirculans (ex Wegman et al. 2014) TaxID=1160721 RepID=A0AAW5KGC6_9FIRM|nr:hypothetical protein [Ruminococcus bicirculans (ex Wegman et al. 2014)]MCQ5151685.1 hypothetical protein [Ruminococcus bicirculans (ex Wegman et al. 2014)]
MKTNEKIKSYEPEKFKEKYKAYLIGLLSTDYKCCGTSKEIEIEKNKAWKKLRGKKIAYYNIYMDPDKKENIDFYNDLSDFLNAASCEHRKDLLFKANGLSKKGIMVYRKKDKKEYFTIHSDQLGFSAVPWIYFSNKYPLSRYFEMQKNKEAAQFLADYVLTTRTLGGSFLWPETLWKGYNRSRGCAKIEDRVDLTLLEIKHYFEYRDLDDKKKFKYRRDILFSRYKIPDAQTWFGFFDSFEDYVDFFMFNDFVDKDKQTKEYTPINILTGKAFETDYPGYKTNTLKEIEDEKQLKAMLDLVMRKVKTRSEKMEDLINEYNQTNDTKGEKHENILHE